MISNAFAMGQGAGAGAGGFTGFIPLILIIILVILNLIFFKLGKKKGKQIVLGSKCETCGIIFTKGETFCIKCDKPLS